MQRSDDTDHPIQNPAVTLADPHLEALERYWSSLRIAESIPVRTALNPAEIEHVLPFAFIIQRVAAGTARFRVAGQRIHDLLKMDARGMPFSTLFHPDDREALRELTEAAFTDPAVIGLPLQSRGNMLRPHLDGAMLLLPMQDSASQTTRLLGALVTPQHAAHRPRRFHLRSDGRTRYDRLRTEQPVAVLKTSQSLPTQRPDTSMRPALRLVVNNG